jgi:hypothetical protein
MSEERTGVDLETVLMSESDGACGVTHVAPPEEVAVQREMHKLSGTDPVGVPMDVPIQGPVQDLLREQNRILLSVLKFIQCIAGLSIALVIGMTTAMLVIIMKTLQ